MHFVDRSAAWALRMRPRQGRVFADGWGDPEAVALLDATATGPPVPIEVSWDRPQARGRLVVRAGRFPAPVVGLPVPAHIAHVLHVAPAGQETGSCVLLPAWNDEGYRTRIRLATGLAAAGIGSYLLEAPFYGLRRIAPGSSPVRTVADFATLTRSVVEEGRSLVAALVAAGRRTGVAGYSMGGSLAATVAATLDLPIAVAPLAAAHAPAPVFTSGVLRNAVAWDALGPDGRERLTEVLLRPSLLRLPPSPPTRCAVLVAASGDGFVAPAATKAIHEHWPGSELRVVRAGHATLLWRHVDILVSATAHAFARAAAAASEPSGEAESRWT